MWSTILLEHYEKESVQEGDHEKDAVQRVEKDPVQRVEKDPVQTS